MEATPNGTPSGSQKQIASHPTRGGGNASGGYSGGNASGNAAADNQASRGPQRGVHEPTGYSWDKEEDAPGYAWKNKRAREDAQRAWENLGEKERMVARIRMWGLKKEGRGDRGAA